MKFQIGDRVVLIVNYPDDNEDLVVGSQGEVVGFNNRDHTRLCVRWDEYVNGHTCNGMCDDGRGWNVNSDQVIAEDNREVADEDVAGYSDICSFIGVG